MITTVIRKRKVISWKRRFLIETILEDEKIIMRKSEIIFGINVPLDETYVTDNRAAIKLETLWTFKLLGFTLN
ncbi:MAG: hypothetical protein A2066_13000 [Bacteroidetes bacterium GWB2_41_8]|nr:MAG: hypothetical protein A2066_13000 [Bacteroidetes bacterium GWB2_41_8]